MLFSKLRHLTRISFNFFNKCHVSFIWTKFVERDKIANIFKFEENNDKRQVLTLLASPSC